MPTNPSDPSYPLPFLVWEDSVAMTTMAAILSLSMSPSVLFKGSRVHLRVTSLLLCIPEGSSLPCWTHWTQPLT